jgi:hypothetical protein
VRWALGAGGDAVARDAMGPGEALRRRGLDDVPHPGGGDDTLSRRRRPAGHVAPTVTALHAGVPSASVFVVLEHHSI